MTAIRGLMWGSSEFVELAKTSEKRGELDDHIEDLYETVGDIFELSGELTEEQRQQLRYIMTDIFEMVGEGRRANRMRVFTFRESRTIVLNIVALRISLYGTTIMTELRLLAKNNDSVSNLKAMTDSERDIISERVVSLIDYYDQISRKERRRRLRKLYTELNREEGE